jgi:hypothetical protein
MFSYRVIFWAYWTGEVTIKVSASTKGEAVEKALKFARIRYPGKEFTTYTVR